MQSIKENNKDIAPFEPSERDNVNDALHMYNQNRNTKITNRMNNKMSRMGFVSLSMTGFFLPLFIFFSDIYFINYLPVQIWELLYYAPFIVIIFFVISFINIMNKNSVNLNTYVFIITAPWTINLIFNLFIPVTFISYFGSFIGIFVSYFYLSGKDLFI